MYSVSITNRAERDLRKLDRQIKNRVTKCILGLANDPRPAGCLKVQSEEGVWRVRVGDWRVAYTVEDTSQEILVIRIAHRSEFYS
jgi:mRNA interferase RelE/StbE